MERGASPLPKSSYDPGTVRRVPKKLMFDGYECTGCHAVPEPGDPDPWDRDPRKKGQFHERIELQHGRNDRCFNCHNKRRMDSFADYDGSPIPVAKVETLCSKCHGPIYRDWKNGAHGKRTGYWDAKRGEREVAVCIACHAPHSPAFAPLPPAPPPVHPNQRRSGEAHADPAEAHGEHG